MIGRADIEGSKSDVAMNAWPPQASYPCGNFSVTSCLKLVKSKGSIGHAFTVCIRTENLNQATFALLLYVRFPSALSSTLGHLRYHLTDVPPQPNSPPVSVFKADHAEQVSTLVTQKLDSKIQSLFNQVSKETMKIVVFH